MPRFFYFFLIVLAFASCSQPKNLVYQNVQNFKLNSMGLSKTTVSLDVRLYNPNKFKVKVKDADVDIYVNNKYIGKVFFVKGSYLIPKADTFLLPVKLDVDLKTVLPNAMRLLFDRNLDLKMKGVIKAGKHGVYVSIPIHYEGKQEI